LLLRTRFLDSVVLWLGGESRASRRGEGKTFAR
jgi:hypothetical protein